MGKARFMYLGSHCKLRDTWKVGIMSIFFRNDKILLRDLIQ